MKPGRNLPSPKKCFSRWVDKLQDAVLYYVDELTQLEYRSAPQLTVTIIQEMVLHYLRLLLRASILSEKKPCNQQDAILYFLNELRYTETNLVPDKTMRKLQNMVQLYMYNSNNAGDKSALETRVDQMKDEIVYSIHTLSEAEENSALQRTIKELKATALLLLSRLLENEKEGKLKNNSDEDALKHGCSLRTRMKPPEKKCPVECVARNTSKRTKIERNKRP